jgi:phosphoenolpyruvate synthase/pyruvate phosphate dikinase
MRAEPFDESDDAVMWAIEQIIGAATNSGLTTSPCGQAPSNNPAFVEDLVRLGSEPQGDSYRTTQRAKAARCRDL